MKWYKIVVWVLVAFVGLFFIFALWYKYEYSMEKADAIEVNSPALGRKLLIATQGSPFKDSITRRVVNHYKSDSVFIKVIDVSNLSEINSKDFNAILLLHTWEYSKPPEAVQSFLAKNVVYKNKMVVLTTSGDGFCKMEGVDAITGESIRTNVPDLTEKTRKRLDIVLESEY